MMLFMAKVENHGLSGYCGVRQIPPPPPAPFAVSFLLGCPLPCEVAAPGRTWLSGSRGCGGSPGAGRERTCADGGASLRP